MTAPTPLPTDRAFRHADVPPVNFGSPEWVTECAPLIDVGQKRRPADPQGWASDYLREMVDTNDLRALGYCATCGQAITLRQVGRCVYSEPCGHYRAQGDLARIRTFVARNRARLTPARERSLLALIGR